MGCRILYSKSDDMACLYCSTSMWAFGPVTGESNDGERGPVEVLEMFIKFCPKDPREYQDYELEKLWGEFWQKLEDKELDYLDNVDMDKDHAKKFEDFSRRMEKKKKAGRGK